MHTACHVEVWEWQGESYIVHVYRRTEEPERGSYWAETLVAPGDKIVSDGPSVEEVLHNHHAILPLALRARATVEKRDGEGEACDKERSVQKFTFTDRRSSLT